MQAYTGICVPYLQQDYWWSFTAPTGMAPFDYQLVEKVSQSLLYTMQKREYSFEHFLQCIQKTMISNNWSHFLLSSVFLDAFFHCSILAVN